MTTYDKKRTVAAILMVFMAVAFANLWFGVAPRLAKPILALGVLMGLVYFLRFSPTREDFEEHTRRQKGERR